MGTFQHHGGMAIRGIIRVGELPDDVLGDADDDDDGGDDNSGDFALITTNRLFIKVLDGIGLLKHEHNHDWVRAPELHYIKWHAFTVDVCNGTYDCTTPSGLPRVAKCRCRRLIRVNGLSHLQWGE